MITFPGRYQRPPEKGQDECDQVKKFKKTSLYKSASVVCKELKAKLQLKVTMTPDYLCVKGPDDPWTDPGETLTLPRLTELKMFS
jgi:hypothetical protein